MRINQFIARASGMSRRAADTAIANGRVRINGDRARPGILVADTDRLTLDGKTLHTPGAAVTIMLNKPVGYVCSRNGQGGKTIYDLLPADLRRLKPVGRLDKDSSGLLLLTDDGVLAQALTHPRFVKQKRYEVRLDKELTEQDFEKITKQGVALDDGLSRLGLDFMNDQNYDWRVTMHEGRNRQIRRTFAALGYTVKKLHRTHFGEYSLSPDMKPGNILTIR